MVNIFREIIPNEDKLYRWADKDRIAFSPDINMQNEISRSFYQIGSGGKISVWWSKYISPAELLFKSEKLQKTGIINILALIIRQEGLDVIHSPNTPDDPFNSDYAHCNIIGLKKRPKSQYNRIRRILAEKSRWNIKFLPQKKPYNRLNGLNY